jgi:hypothetical protein
MGYYAHLLKGDPFTITNPTAVLNRLAETEGHSHSWCQPVATYRDGNTDPNALVAIVENFGFSTHALPDEGVIITDFGDNKLGGSWEKFWDAFAQGTTDEVTWLMYGEDGEVWAEVITTNGHRSASVTINYTVEV